METETTHTEANTAGDKTIAIVAYLTFIGLIAAYVMNNEKKDPYAAFHIRQSLGLCVCGIGIFIIAMIPLLGWIASFLGSFFLLYLWIVGLINAINEKEKPVPFLGEKFDEWFKGV